MVVISIVCEVKVIIIATMLKETLLKSPGVCYLKNQILFPVSA